MIISEGDVVAGAKKPELLAPAGSFEALSAAISAGADAVYFGTPAYNARMNAHNFAEEELLSALRLCHAHGVCAHVTLNTQIYDRELEDAYKCAESLYDAGVDALITADAGLARIIHERIPSFPLHASTQMTGHCVRDAEYLCGAGFTRMVAARELSRESMARLCEGSPIEIEMFIHGALCVSVSGQCLMSSVIGGRSGNRGECAQPCRMRYNGSYPLSPKDLCLASHMRELLSLGVASFKLEGRMKSADYVYRTVSVYRRLIDEGRDAEPDEIKELAGAFSRSGFTDAYFTGEVKRRPNEMLGVRTELDKKMTAASRTAIPQPERVRITHIKAEFPENAPSRLTLISERGREVSVLGEQPQTAISKPLTVEYARAQLSKLGATPFTVTEDTIYEINVSAGVTLSASALNALRRDAVKALCLPERAIARGDENYAGSDKEKIESTRGAADMSRKKSPDTGAAPKLTAEFLFPEAITDAAREYFDRIYLPLEKFGDNGCGAFGVVLPPVLYDSDETAILRILSEASSAGAAYAIINGPGQAALAASAGLSYDAGFRFNINNAVSARAALDTGAETAALSPELSAAQLAGIAARVPSSVIVYGRIPVMTTERCILCAVRGGDCRGVCIGEAELCDRMGASFPVYASYGCRSTIYNSVPIYMADKRKTLLSIGAAAWHFIFTNKSAGETDRVINAYRTGAAAENQYKRIK